jgi:hypothetical protein
MDPATAIATVISLIADMLLTNGGRMIAGRYIGGRYFSTTALRKAGYLYTGGGISEARKIFNQAFKEYLNNNYDIMSRKKIATEIYNALVNSNQLHLLTYSGILPPEIKERLDDLLTPKPKVPQPLVRRSIPRLVPVERTSTEHPIQQNVAQENIAERVEQALEETRNAPPEVKTDAVVNAVQEVQQELVSQGNTAAVNPEVVVSSLADAAMKEPEATREAVSEAASQLTGTNPQVVKEEIQSRERIVQGTLHGKFEGTFEPEIKGSGKKRQK